MYQVPTGTGQFNKTLMPSKTPQKGSNWNQPKQKKVNQTSDNKLDH
jgi:hypothetical protein